MLIVLKQLFAWIALDGKQDCWTADGCCDTDSGTNRDGPSPNRVGRLSL